MKSDKTPKRELKEIDVLLHVTEATNNQNEEIDVILLRLQIKQRNRDKIR